MCIQVAFSLSDHDNVPDMATAVWSVDYTGGVSVAANALCRIESMFAEDSRNDSRQITVFLTDGAQYLLEKEAYDVSQRLKEAGVEMFVVGKYE